MGVGDNMKGQQSCAERAAASCDSSIRLGPRLHPWWLYSLSRVHLIMVSGERYRKMSLA